MRDEQDRKKLLICQNGLRSRFVYLSSDEEEEPRSHIYIRELRAGEMMWRVRDLGGQIGLISEEMPILIHHLKTDTDSLFVFVAHFLSFDSMCGSPVACIIKEHQEVQGRLSYRELIKHDL